MKKARSNTPVEPPHTPYTIFSESCGNTLRSFFYANLAGALQAVLLAKPFPLRGMAQSYDIVVGLEVHIQLLTQTKLFCRDATAFGAPPNTQVSAISLAHPGTLPVLNQEALRMAAKLGLALGSQISTTGFFDRKHYFYPDLPKGYQTSQLTHPVLVGGSLSIGTRAVAIHHVHLEEDAGKSIHDLLPEASCIDLNRAGMPLLELVTEPVIHSADEAFAFLTQLRKLVRWLGICDGNMEEGSLRADANISVKPTGQQQLGTKVEVKNLNSIRNVKRAIAGEAQRQISLLEAGETIVQQTRGYDAEHDTTHAQREKEEANDYRYFPCPDIPPYHLPRPTVESLQETMPELPWEKFRRYTETLGLSDQDAAVLTEDLPTATYFDALHEAGAAAKPAANWLLGPVKNWLNQQQLDMQDFTLPAPRLADIIRLVQQGDTDFSQAAQKLLPAVMEKPDAEVPALAASLGLLATKDDAQLEQWIQQVLQAMPDKVLAYQKGKKNLMGLFMGEIKKLSGGKADPKTTMKLLEDALTK